MTAVLVFNAGSSSIKFALFGSGLERLLSGQATEIGREGTLEIAGARTDARFANHAEALEAILRSLEAQDVRLSDIDGAAHRIVHGGRNLVAPCRLSPEIITEIEDCIPLAPLHNPHNLAVIRAIGEAAPQLPQFASFDTAFHASNPEVALRYAVPSVVEKLGIRRYGFHGISFSGLVQRLPDFSGTELPGRLLALHLGNGASLCAIREGRSAATTMGYSPLDGLTMGTRTGTIDGNAVLRLAAEFGIEQTRTILNHESGLKGLGGISDMRALRATETTEADFAITHFCYWAIRHAGSMIAAMGGIDAMAFTGGIGENDAGVRAAIMQGLDWTGIRFDGAANAKHALRLHGDGSTVEAWLIPADEERTIASNAIQLF